MDVPSDGEWAERSTDSGRINEPTVCRVDKVAPSGRCQDHPPSRALAEQERILLSRSAGFLLGCRYLIHDCSSLFAPDLGSSWSIVPFPGFKIPTGERPVLRAAEGGSRRPLLANDLEWRAFWHATCNEGHDAKPKLKTAL